jgi:hypothetical protein
LYTVTGDVVFIVFYFRIFVNVRWKGQQALDIGVRGRYKLKTRTKSSKHIIADDIC